MKIYLRNSTDDKKTKNKILNQLKIQESKKEDSDYYLYVVTPKLVDFFFVSDLVDDSYDYPEKTIYCILKNEITGSKSNIKISFSDDQMKMLNAIGDIIKRNGGKYFKNLDEVVNFLNRGERNGM